MESTLPGGGKDGNAGPLLPRHRADLVASGLRDDVIAASGAYSESDPDKVRDLLGGYLSVKTARAMGPCLALPFRDAAGAAMTWTHRDEHGRETVRPFVRLKPDRPRKRDGRPVKYETPLGCGNRVYLPPGTGAALSDPTAPLVVVEGEKKALAGTQDGFPAVGLSGVWNWVVKRPRDPATGRKQGARELIDDLRQIRWAGRRVTVVFDSDLAGKPEVEWARWHLARALGKHGADVRAVDLPGGPGGGKCGLDDFLLARGAAAFRLLLDTARPPARPEPEGGDDRPPVLLGEDEHRVNDEVAARLAHDPAVYQRGGELVRVAVETPPADGPRLSVAPRIEVIPPAALRHVVSRRVRFVQQTEKEARPAHPPAWCVNAVAARGGWPGVRPLTGVVSFPVVRADGTLVTDPGYDAATGLYLHWPGPPLTVPGRPTPADARAAAAELLDAVGDFPFAAGMHKAAWLAGLLTPLARPAFDGPAPLFLVDANVRAAGKGLCLEVVSRVVTGNPFPVVSYPASPKDGEEELRKKITTLLMYGDRLALFDNLTGGFGDGTLDRALTGSEWQDRRLGSNALFRGPLAVTFFATGNNVLIRADTARRVCHIRLESPHERPENRADLRRPRLVAWVVENRDRLLAAALTVLRGYFAAGRPDFGLRPWGSFEAWSGVVRNAVVWCGLPDPGDTRLAVQEGADETARGLAQLIAALELVDPGRAGRTAAEVVAAGFGDDSPHAPEVREMVREAVGALAGKPDARKLGNALRHLRRRVIDGKYLDLAGEDARRVNRWAVFAADRLTAQPAGRPPRPPHPAASPVDRPDVEDVEDVNRPEVVPAVAEGDEERF